MRTFFKDINKTFLSSAVFYCCIFMGSTVVSTYITLYYSSINLSKGTIGIIAAIGAVVMLVSQPLWGTIADNARSKNRVLMTAIIATGLLVWLYPLAGKSAFLIGAVTVIFSFFNNAVHPMCDTIAVELAVRGGFKFSAVRTIGSLGFALMAAAAGQLLAASIFVLFPLFSALRFLSAAALHRIPVVKGHGHKRPDSASFIELFKDRKLVLFYIYAFLLSITWTFFSAFYPVAASEAGIATGLIGLGMTIGSVSQFPFMLLFDRLYKRFGVINIFIFSGVMYAVRWFFFSTSLSPHTIIFLMALHGLNYIVIYLCLTEYVGTHVPSALKTRGQMMNSLTMFGVSSIAGTLGGGQLSEIIGLPKVFMLSAVLCIFAVAVFFIFTKIVWKVHFVREKMTPVIPPSTDM